MDGKLITAVLGTAAAVCSVASFLPQIVKMVKTRDVSGVSLRTYGLTVACFGLWIAYGIRLGALPIAVSNALALLASTVVLFLKWRYRKEPTRNES